MGERPGKKSAEGIGQLVRKIYSENANDLITCRESAWLKIKGTSEFEAEQ
jgi:hypothetical protein